MKKIVLVAALAVLSVSSFAQSLDYEKGQKDGLATAKMYKSEISNEEREKAKYNAVEKVVVATKKEAICKRELFHKSKPTPAYYNGFLSKCLPNI